MFIDWIFRIQLFRKLQFTENWLMDSIFFLSSFILCSFFSVHWMQTTKLITDFPRLYRGKINLDVVTNGENIFSCLVILSLCFFFRLSVSVVTPLLVKLFPILGLCALFLENGFFFSGQHPFRFKQCLSIYECVSWHVYWLILSRYYTVLEN